MSLILLWEVLESRENGVRCSLSKSAETALLHGKCDLAHLSNILVCCLALGNLSKKSVKRLSSDSAWCAFSTSLIDSKIEIELGNIDDTVILIHYDHASRSHHRTDLHEGTEIDWSIEILLGDYTT